MKVWKKWGRGTYFVTVRQLDRACHESLLVAWKVQSPMAYTQNPLWTRRDSQLQIGMTWPINSVGFKSRAISDLCIALPLGWLTVDLCVIFPVRRDSAVWVGGWRIVHLMVSEGSPCLRRIQQIVNNSTIVDQNYAFREPGRHNITACSAEWARQEQIKTLSTLKNATPLSACTHKMSPAFHVE